MKHDLQLKLQAYLDCELPPGEAKAVTDWLAGDGAARGLLTELTNTRAAIAAHEAEIKVPSSADFYWSGIRRAIEQQAKSTPPEAVGVSIFTWLRRMLLPASGLVAVLLAVTLTWQPFRSQGTVVVEETETTFADAGAFTYRDYASGTTLVWVSYPAENDFAEMDLGDILDIN